MGSRPLAVLFDLDGTLVDTVPLILASMRHAFAGQPRCPTDAEWIAGLGIPLRVQLADFTSSSVELEAIVERYRLHQLEHHDRMTRAYPGAVEAVREVKALGHAVGIVTGKFQETATRTLAYVGLLPYVDVVVGSNSCAGHKPDPEPVLLALDRLGRAPADALFLGDAPVDVQAGNAAGVRSVAALWGPCGRAALLAASPHHLLEGIAELGALVRSLAQVPSDPR